MQYYFQVYETQRLFHSLKIIYINFSIYLFFILITN